MIVTHLVVKLSSIIFHSKAPEDIVSDCHSHFDRLIDDDENVNIISKNALYAYGVMMYESPNHITWPFVKDRFD